MVRGVFWLAFVILVIARVGSRLQVIPRMGKSKRSHAVKNEARLRKKFMQVVVQPPPALLDPLPPPVLHLAPLPPPAHPPPFRPGAPRPFTAPVSPEFAHTLQVLQERAEQCQHMSWLERHDGLMAQERLRSERRCDELRQSAKLKLDIEVEKLRKVEQEMLVGKVETQLCKARLFKARLQGRYWHLKVLAASGEEPCTSDPYMLTELLSAQDGKQSQVATAE